MRKVRRKYLIVAAVLVALPLLVLVEERLRGEWLLAACKRDLIARGEKLTVEELTPPAPKGTNVWLGASSEVQALLSVGTPVLEEMPDSVETLSPGRAVVAWQRKQWPRVDGTLCTWEDYVEASKAARSLLPELRDQLTNNLVRLNLDYRGLWGMNMRYLSAYKSSCWALCQEAIYDLHRGDVAGALANLHAASKTVVFLGHGPLLIDQLVAIAMAGMAQGAVWQALQSGGWTDAQLALLQADWQQIQFTPQMIAALRMERAIMCSWFPDATFNRPALQSCFDGWTGSILIFRASQEQSSLERLAGVFKKLIGFGARQVRIGLWRYVWADRDESLLMRGVQELLDLCQQADDDRTFAAICNLDEDASALPTTPLLNQSRKDPKPGPTRLVSGSFLRSLLRAPTKAARADAWNEVMVAAIALKRHHLKYGSWPESLPALVPEFLLVIPVDRMDGQPLRYRLREDGTYLLYSVGEDGIDQGGDPAPIAKRSRNWFYGRDFVWAQPASSEEVAAADAKTVAEATSEEGRRKGELTVDEMRRLGLLPPAPRSP